MLRPNKRDIDNRSGERIIRQDGSIKFFHDTYTHPDLKPWAGFPVIVQGYGWCAIDVYLIERRSKKRWGKGKFLCMIDTVTES